VWQPHGSAGLHEMAGTMIVDDTNAEEDIDANPH
jgi:hypothetical protein